MRTPRRLTVLDRLEAAGKPSFPVASTPQPVGEGGIKEGAVTGGKIAAEAIEAGHIKANTITAAQIKAGTITATEIEAGSLTADRLDVEELSAISADLGTITAGTITGALVRTAASGARVEIDSEGIRGINASAVEKFSFDTASGILTASGVISSETGSVIDTEHLAGQITETQIEDDAITSPKIKANSVEAAHIAVANLAAISADIGAITAGTLTGTTFRTAAENPKVIMDAEGLRSIDEGGNEIVSLTGEDGLVLLGTEETNREISWVDSEGLKSGYVESVRSPGQSVAQLVSEQGSAEEAAANVLALGDDGASAGLRAKSNGATEGSVRAFVTGEAGVERLLIDSLGKSDFLQLATLAKRKIAFGSSTVTFSASSTSAGKNVAHGLGTTPSAVIAVMGEGQALVNIAVSTGATNNTFIAARIDGAAISATLAFYWIAIG